MFFMIKNGMLVRQRNDLTLSDRSSIVGEFQHVPLRATYESLDILTEERNIMVWRLNKVEHVPSLEIMFDTDE